MKLSEPISTQPSVEQFRGGTATIPGSLVPKLSFELDGTGAVFFEHHPCCGRTPHSRSS